MAANSVTYNDFREALISGETCDGLFDLRAELPNDIQKGHADGDLETVGCADRDAERTRKYSPVRESEGQRYFEQYGGKRAVYARILSETNCANLLREFQLAADNNDRAERGTAEYKWTTGYMNAAASRMRDQGCLK